MKCVKITVNVCIPDGCQFVKRGQESQAASVRRAVQLSAELAAKIHSTGPAPVVTSVLEEGGSDGL